MVCIFQTEVCHLLPMHSVLYTDDDKSAGLPPEGHTELPTCPVCLGFSLALSLCLSSPILLFSVSFLYASKLGIGLVTFFGLSVSERLDQDTSGIQSTLCDHSFQCSCISKWTHLSCQVCFLCNQTPILLIWRY